MYTEFVKPYFKKTDLYHKFLVSLFVIQSRIELKKGIGILIVDNGQPIGVAFFGPSHTITDLWDYLWAGGLKLIPYLKNKMLFELLKQNNLAEEACQNEAGKGTWYLSLLAIDAKYQGQHLGSNLLNHHIFSYLKEKRVKKLTLITNTENNCNFYKKNGFKNFDINILGSKKHMVNNWSFIKNI